MSHVCGNALRLGEERDAALAREAELRATIERVEAVCADAEDIWGADPSGLITIGRLRRALDGA